MREIAQGKTQEEAKVTCSNMCNRFKSRKTRISRSSRIARTYVLLADALGSANAM
jgi:hypothetical protein